MTRTYEPRDLFAADAHAMNAGNLIIRAVTAGEHGRFVEQRDLIAQAADALGRSLALLNPALAAPTIQDIAA